VTDARGRQITLPSLPKRIVSLMPSNTEIVYALGAGDRLVMDTPSCDYPPAARRRPHVDPLKGDIEPVLAARPDLVIADDRYEDRMVAALERAHIPTLVLGVRSIDQTYTGIRLIGRAIGTDANAATLVKQMQSRLDRLRAATAPMSTKPAVLVMIGANPIYTSGPDEFISEVISIAGGVNVITAPLPGNIVSAEKVVELQPEVIIAAPDIQARAARIPGWAAAVPAVQNRRYVTLDPPLMRPGPRLPEAAYRLAHALHPELRP
jgi:iron complex transport system substrate-binding protein